MGNSPRIKNPKSKIFLKINGEFTGYTINLAKKLIQLKFLL